MHTRHTFLLWAALLVPVAMLSVQAQEPARPESPQTPAPPAPPVPPQTAQQPQFTSAEVSPDRRITFRIFAPHAQAVTLRASDIPGTSGPGVTPPGFTKAENGVWEVSVGPVPAGAYRYTFTVDGLDVVDPRNPQVSQSNNNVWSLVLVPGSDVFDVRNVPHGAVAAVEYYSTSLEKFRRMHVYTPPGYESNQTKYPVFYLLHGASDSDDSWTSVGRANFILDNLIAANKIKPMVVVMPAGHTRPFMPGRGAPPAAAATPPRDEFFEDFVSDIMPYAEKHYRVLTDRSHRAIAGLSMGGAQTLNAAFSHLDKFSYIGVFSSGILGNNDPSKWQSAHTAMLDDPKLKKDLKLVWFSTGSDDRLITNSKNTVELLKKHGFNPVFQESSGGHTWLNWRDYLAEFTPQLFQ
jgi:enterochelin esterase-like enzyme